MTCAAAQNFSQYPGFAAYFAQHPPSNRAADARERAVLRRYRPRLWIGPDQDGPIGFYRDYIAHGVLRDGRGRVISDHVNRALLNRYARDPAATFVHRPSPGITHPLVFARIDRASLPGAGACNGPFTFLTYNFVFRDSGLPAGLSAVKAAPLALVADLDDWHALDHYTAASIVLDAWQRPVALVLQQHNDLRSYIFGADLAWPANNHVRLSAALRSNELYPWTGTRQRHRTVRFMSADSLRYLVTGRDKPFFASEDITQAAREIDYKLGFLPQDDAFYMFEGALGEHRRLPGRDGPPGASYHSLPMFMNRALQLVAFHWHEGDIDQMQALLAFLRQSRKQDAAAIDSPAFSRLCVQFMSTLENARP